MSSRRYEKKNWKKVPGKIREGEINEAYSTTAVGKIRGTQQKWGDLESYAILGQENPITG